MSWNVESGGNDPKIIAKQLRDLEGFDLVGLQEVRSNNAGLYRSALEFGEGVEGSTDTDFRLILGNSGRSDRLAIIYDAMVLEAVGDPVELVDLQEGGHRAPLFQKFRHIPSEAEFIFMNNHLARGNATARQNQAKGLLAWARQQNVPILNVGDFNFDYQLDYGAGNKAYDFFLVDDIWTWVKPDRLYKTSLSLSYNGILDFIFTANTPDTWDIDSWIIKAGMPQYDDAAVADHRIVVGRIFF